MERESALDNAKAGYLADLWMRALLGSDCGSFAVDSKTALFGRVCQGRRMETDVTCFPLRVVTLTEMGCQLAFIGCYALDGISFIVKSVF